MTRRRHLVPARLVLLALLATLVGATLGGCDLFLSTQARLQRANRELRQGEYRAALIDVREVTAGDPRNATAWLLEADISLLLGDAPAARQALDAAADAGAPPSRLAVPRAKLLVAAGKPDQLLKETDLHTLALTEPDRSIYRGEAFALLQRYPDAETSYRAALAANPSSLDAQLGMAELYLVEGQSGQALALVERAQVSSPSSASVWRLRGLIDGSRGRFREMASALETAWRLRVGQLSVPNEVQLLAALIDVHLALGETSAAETRLGELRTLAPNTVLTQLEAGRTALAKHDYAAAVPPLTAVVNASPGLIAGRFMLGSALLAQKQFGRAEHELSLVVAQVPSNVAAREQLARARLALGLPNDAIAALSPLQQSSAGNVDGQIGILLGVAQMQAGQPDVAIAQLERSSAANPKDYRLKLLLADLYEREHQLQQAETCIEEALRISGGKANALASAGMLYMQAQRYDQAVAVLRAAVAAEPKNSLYRLQLARAHLALNQPEFAAEDARAALADQPDAASALRVLALIDVSAHRASDALARVQAAEKRHRADVDLVILEGDIQMANGQYSIADAVYARANMIRGTAESAIKSYMARRAGRLPNELQPLENWLVQKPDDVPVRRLVAAAYLKAGRDTEAQRAYEFLVANDPRDVVSLNNLAWLYEHSGDSRALDTAREAYDLAPSNPDVADTYGWALLQAGSAAESVEVLDKAVKASSNGDIRFHLASALARLGDRARARAELQELLHSNPTGFSEHAAAERLLNQL